MCYKAIIQLLMGPVIRDLNTSRELYHGPDMGRSENKGFVFTPVSDVVPAPSIVVSIDSFAFTLDYSRSLL